VTEPVCCTVCRAGDAAVAHVVDGHRIVRCRRCGHLYVSPRPPLDEIREIYGEHYFQNPAFERTDHDAYFGYMDYLRDRERIVLRLGEVLARIERHEWRGRLLDVGCGPGFFVATAAASGWDAWGVELNKHAVAWANEHVTDRVLHGTVETLEFPDAAFDCVTMFDVIEHLPDPRSDLLDVWRVLRPGGLLVVVTPDAGALVPRLLGSRWLEMKRAPEHLHFFSVDTLARLLRLGGFSAFEWHSIGKITTVRTVLADLKFYSPAAFGALERWLARRGWDEKVVDVDPRTKMCLYARKTGAPLPFDAPTPAPDEVMRVRRRTSLPRRLARAPRLWVRSRRLGAAPRR
jgi:2-polyprenyl-3-methyl-5-hydroxy-6-metoxy-1,4-benzoquinol methylase